MQKSVPSLITTRQPPLEPGGGPGVAPLFPALTLLCHPALDRIGQRAVLERLATGIEQALSRLEPLFRHPHTFTTGEAIGDASVSRRPVQLRPLADGSIAVVPPDGKGAVRIEGEPIGEEGIVVPAPLLGSGITIELGDRVALLLHRIPPPEPETASLGLLGHSPAIERVRRQIVHLTDGSVPVLLLGESGTGKELAARALHDVSPRRGGPFVTCNIASIPPSMIAAELFGHARGAFTGAGAATLGLFRRAHGGTLLLDEIGEAPPDTQVALLRTIETRQVVPLGADESIDVDVRVIAATDADLSAAVARGAFRGALLHRLEGYTIDLPPLRDRRDDVARLLAHFVREHAHLVTRGTLAIDDLAVPPWMNAALMGQLVRHDWPGNVRELQNVLRQLVLASGGQGPLHAGLLPRSWRSTRPAISSGPSPGAEAPPPRGSAPTLESAEHALGGPPTSARKTRRRVADIGEDELIRALAENRWVIGRAAVQLGISRNSLLTRMEQSPNVRRPKDLDLRTIELCRAQCGGDLGRMSEQLAVSERGLEQRMRELGLL
jgi:two-component system, NtrC family, nitrogen regulation response regulator GlnG